MLIWQTKSVGASNTAKILEDCKILRILHGLYEMRDFMKLNSDMGFSTIDVLPLYNLPSVQWYIYWKLELI